MQKEMQIKKKKLLQRISKRKYVKLLKFIEKVYLSEYDLKILMARKFSNLFFTLLPLVQQENGNRVMHLYDGIFEKREQPTIISHRALTMVKHEIQSGKYKKILLADDIIVRGRTMTQVYELLKEWFEEAGITDYEIAAYAYAENRERKIKNDDFEKIKKVEQVCSVSEWRAISNEIVDIFYLLGTAYTSYVPNSRIDMNSELGHTIAQQLERQDSAFMSLTSAEMVPYSIKAYAYTCDNNIPAILNASIRIYEYQELQQYIVVPMVILNPVSEEVLREYLSVVSVLMPEASVERLSMITEDDIVYRAVVYIVSALWGWKFVYEYLGCSYSDLKYEIKEEQINFFMPLLEKNVVMKFDKSALESIWGEIWSHYREVPELENSLFIKENDIVELNDLLEKSMTEFDKSNWSGNYVRELLGKYLYLNGILDEKRIKESKNVPGERLLGYPLVMLKNKLKQYETDWVWALLYAIDFGKGSILSSTMHNNGKNYFVSMLHEGEQNYKYLENAYFPFLYGLYHIEYTSERQRAGEKISDRKNEFVAYMKQYWKDKGYFYLDDDIRRMEEMYVGANFENVLANDAWSYLDNEDLKMAIMAANKVLTEGIDDYESH